MSRTIGLQDLSRWALAALILTALLSSTACGLVTGRGESGDVMTEPYGGDGVMKQDALVSEEAARDAAIAPAPPVAPGGAGPDASTVPPEERLVIRTVGLRVQVDDVEKAVAAVRKQTADAGGMVTTVQVSTDEQVPIYRYEATGSLADGAPLRGFVVVRIPADKLEGFVDAVSKLGTVQRQVDDESDVTQEHIDLTARITSYEAQEARLRELFEKAANVEEMLAIEQELTRVRAEIESMRAQVAYLERQAAMATVTVEFAGKPSIVSPGGADWGFVDAIRRGVRGLVNTINTVIVVLLSALPVIVLGAGLALIVRWALRRRHVSGDDEVASEEPRS